MSHESSARDQSFALRSIVLHASPQLSGPMPVPVSVISCIGRLMPIGMSAFSNITSFFAGVSVAPVSAMTVHSTRRPSNQRRRRRRSFLSDVHIRLPASTCGSQILCLCVQAATFARALHGDTLPLLSLDTANTALRAQNSGQESRARGFLVSSRCTDLGS